MDKNINAVIYARYSSHNQNEMSIEGQVRVCKEYAQKNKMNVISVYADRALTGKNDKRPEFQKMIKDSSKKIFLYVICYKVDRFSRNRYDSVLYKNKLKNNGVRVVYAEGSIPDTPEGVLMESLMEGWAEYFSKNLAVNVIRGARENAMKCRSNGGTPPMGYKCENGKYVIDTNTAPIIIDLFDRYASGVPISYFVHEFGRKGILTSRGKPFSRHTILGILKNPKYIGVFEYKGHDGTITIEDGIPRLVSDSVFNAAQEIIGGNVRTAYLDAIPVGNSRHPLNGKLVCGVCGSPIYLRISSSCKDKFKYWYYSCSKKVKLIGCSLKNRRVDLIEEMVISCVKKEIFSKKSIKELARKAALLQEKDKELPNKLTLKLADINKSINNLLNVIETGVSSSAITKRLTELEQKRKDILVELDNAKMKEVNRLTDSQIEFFLARFIAGFVKDEEFMLDLLQEYVKEIKMHEEKIVVNLYLIPRVDDFVITREIFFSNW